MYKSIKKFSIAFLLLISLIPLLFSCSHEKIDVSKFSSVAEFNRKEVRIGVPISSKLSLIAEQIFNNASIEYFSSGPDLLIALNQDKIDALLISDYDYVFLKDGFPFMKLLDDIFIGHIDIGIGFPKNDKGKKLQRELNEYIYSIKQSGELQKRAEYWIDVNLPSNAEVDFSELENINGELSMYTESQTRPFAFVYYGKDVGLELEIVKNFCKEKGYALNLVRTSSVLPALTSGKCDIVCNGIEIIEEKKRHILFSEPVYIANGYIAIKDKNYIKTTSIFADVIEGIDQTFFAEGRYKQFISGTLTTIIISILTLIFGTLLGFALYLAYYNGYTFVGKIFNFLSWLFSRLPMLVFLMFVLYVVFAKVDISGIIVSIISFTIVFATTVFSILDSNVQNIEYGQIEAASSLGYNKTKTFFKIILLQILPNLLPTYKSEILNLVKSTSIVGYVMVSDLTKVGDIVRSRTYAAFFPLVAVAIIYIILAKIIIVVVDFLSITLLNKLKIAKDKLKETKEND